MPDKQMIQVQYLVKIRFKISTLNKKKAYDGKVVLNGKEYVATAHTKAEVIEKIQLLIKGD